MRRLIFLVSICLFTGVAYAQDEDTDESGEYSYNEPDMEAKNPSTLSATREYASEELRMHKFDEKKWREVVDARDYSDTRTKKNPKDRNTDGRGGNGERSGKRGFDDEDDDGQYEYDSGDSGINLSWLGPIGQIIFYVAIALIIGLIITQIVRNTSFKANPKRTASLANVAEEIHDISELDTDSLIRKAHDAGDYKLAIRLYFLDLLKKLNENGTIVWTKDKTNRDYLSEVFSKQYYFNEVRRLTLAYERVWYGEHIPSDERYQTLRNEFQEISQKFSAS